MTALLIFFHSLCQISGARKLGSWQLSNDVWVVYFMHVTHAWLCLEGGGDGIPILKLASESTAVMEVSQKMREMES